MDTIDILMNRIRILVAFDLDIETIVETITNEDKTISMDQIFLCYHAAKILDKSE